MARDYFDEPTQNITVPITCSSVTDIVLEYKPLPPATQFDRYLTLKGVNVGVVKLTKTGEDKYGNPTYSETITNTKGFVKTRGREKAFPTGTVKLSKAIFMLSLSEDIEEDGYEISYGGWRWKIVAIDVRRAYLEVVGERKVA